MALPRRRLATLAAVAMAAASLTGGCAEPVDGPVLVLTLASADVDDEVTGPQIRRFAAEVDRRSGGTMRIEPMWDVAPHGQRNWDQRLGRAIATGTYDLGLVTARSWDMLDVTSLEALSTPFLVTGDAQQQAVLDSNVRDDLLAGLSAAGVVGIDLWPGPLRRPFGFDKPLLGPADYAGQTIRSGTSRTVTDLLTRLGVARVVDVPISAAHQRGLESSFPFAGVHVIATGNVVFFTKIMTLVADDAVRQRLRPDQWQVLHDAAAFVRTDEAAFLDDEESTTAFCAQPGNKIVAAGPTDLAALHAVGDQVRNELAEDPDTAELIDAVEAVVSTVPAPEPLTGCPAGESESGDTAAGDVDETSVLDGVYLTRVTRDDLVEAGVTDPDQLRENTGRITWTLDAGYWHHIIRANHYLTDNEQAGTYTYEDGRFTLYWGSEEVITARVDIAGDGSIRFHDLQDNLPELQKPTEGFFGQPWRRISDLPE